MNTLDLQSAFEKILAALRDPKSDPKTTALVIGVITVFVLIVMVIGVLLILTSSEDEEEEWIEEPTGPASGAPAYQPGPTKTVSQPLFTITGIALALVVGLGIWMVAGYATARPDVCLSCHADNPHVKGGAKDPHAKVNCVECHETGGLAGSLGFVVAPRVAHIILSNTPLAGHEGYPSAVSSSDCERCHGKAIANTITIADQKVRVSHKEPLAAGAPCLDCHQPSSGVITSRTVGMTPCLRCHDGKTAKGECAYCHIGDVAVAVRASEETTPGGRQDLVTYTNCYGCHDPKPCDACHGIRMPHTKEFMMHGHARIAAINIWFGDGKQCIKCHNAARRPCTQCHYATPPQHGQGSGFATAHQYGSPQNCSTACHSYQTGNGTHLMCAFCHDGPIQPKKTPPIAPTIPTTTP